MDFSTKMTWFMFVEFILTMIVDNYCFLPLIFLMFPEKTNVDDNTAFIKRVKIIMHAVRIVILFYLMLISFGLAIGIDVAFLLLGVFYLNPRVKKTSNDKKVFSDVKVSTTTDPALFKDLKCPNCNNPVLNGDVYCKSCGRTLRNTCPHCGLSVDVNQSYCTNCGTLVNTFVFQKEAGANNSSNAQTIGATAVQNAAQIEIKDLFIPPNNFSVINENEVVERLIDDELINLGVDKNSDSLISFERRKNIINIIFALFTFVFVSLIFFHLDMRFYYFYIPVLLIYIIYMKRLGITKYIRKQVVNRPDEKIKYIVSSLVASEKCSKKSSKYMIIYLAVAFILPLIIFMKPITLYEKANDGYHVRFYIMGLTSLTKAEIPSTYKGEPVTGLRGEAFANMFFLKNVDLPDSIHIIRGQAFENDYMLESVKLPNNLTELGGSAFKNCHRLKNIVIPYGVTVINGETFVNCTSLEKVELPESVIEIHGETFINCTSLKEINIPSKVTSIRGNTFENCTSLKEIVIPEGVTEIRAHAFRGCTSLSDVTIPSTLTSIGRSAFRECYSLRTITLPQSTIIGEKAFKDSPTNIIRSSNYGTGQNISYPNVNYGY